MRYLPHTRDQIKSMLKKTGHADLDNLFDCIPGPLKTDNDLDIGEPLSEWALDRHMAALAGKNMASGNGHSFIGAGSYDHYIPAFIRHLISRSEFMTAYTPYQPEISQGTLQGIYEFQTMVTQLLGMDVATASHYDGGTALAEAALICLRSHKTANRIAVSTLTHPAQRDIIKTYLRPTPYEMVEIGYTDEGKTDLAALEKMEDIAGVCLQSPNFFGVLEQMDEVRRIADEKQILMVASFTEALSFGLIKNPGAYGADIAAGEGQSLGLNQSFGGPGLGLLASKEKLMRRLPGRLVGKTKDIDDRRGYVLTLATREQHIRREKASSNICSNNGLCAMTAGIYMAACGKTGLRKIAQINHDHAAYLKKILTRSGLTPAHSSEFFNEFVMKAPEQFKSLHDRLVTEKATFAGLDLEPFFPKLKNHYLFCATETADKASMDELGKVLETGILKKKGREVSS